MITATLIQEAKALSAQSGQSPIAALQALSGLADESFLSALLMSHF